LLVAELLPKQWMAPQLSIPPEEVSELHACQITCGTCVEACLVLIAAAPLVHLSREQVQHPPVKDEHYVAWRAATDLRAPYR
jgi:hypothetical protein